MLWWDGQLLAKTKELMLKAKQEWNIYLYMRYVDDENFVTEGIQPGIRYEGGKLVKVTSLVKHDEDVPTDVRMARIVQQVANSISDYIQVEIDCPSMHKNKRLPMLDLEVEMINNTVQYRHYRKEMAIQKWLWQTVPCLTKPRKCVLFKRW